ncbi:hypothetical protein Verru16b_00479 [Lacunisphaera limnophila]|uniref:Uncharacterized protein n=1 Tax=Lacunisphaera limnophila TaxID=1838286 RepID=A0A1D8ARC6_9BACT|nr:hypothetical protein [Lacunisphaera limnophila]AOS43436.1 hypothetical protein Verru16b_00479 [Lacunisphaera limnophila]
MRSLRSIGISEEKFQPWLRREILQALKWGAGLLLGGLALAGGLTAVSPSFAGTWTTFNYQLSSVALDQHPVALVRTFAARLRESEYGWAPLGLGAPFNITEARQRLKSDFPEVASVVDGVPQVPRALSLKRANPARYEQRLAEYVARHQRIESVRFTSLYDRDDLFSPPNANVKLGLFATKVFGLLDALLYTLSTIVGGGLPGVLLFGTVLSLSAPALWRSRRPARIWLKLLAWPTLASALIWGAIFFMAVASAMLGGFTPNTSAVTLLATLPLLFTLAKAPLHLAETLVTPAKKWDGIDRRKPRPPEAPPGMTTPPIGGA